MFNFKKRKKMKKIMMTLAAVCVAATMNAQVYVGGSLGFNSKHSGVADKNYTTFTIAPEVGYTLSDKFAVGVALGFTSGDMLTYQDKFGATYTGKATAFEIKPYARYTFAKLDNFSFFVDGAVWYGNANLKNVDVKYNEYGIALEPGIAYNVNDKISLVAHIGSLGFSSMKADYSGAKADTEFGLGVSGSALSFGLYYNF